MANEVIKENINVEFLTPSKRELKKIKIRRDLPNTNEQIRIVKIGDLDINACCGVHPSKTLDVQLIKIKKWEKHKGATRIEYLAGNRAIKDYFRKDEFRNKICKLFWVLFWKKLQFAFWEQELVFVFHFHVSKHGIRVQQSLLHYL